MTAGLRSSAATILEAGDSALLLVLGDDIEEQVNARAVAVAASLREAPIPGVRDVVPTFTDVAVFFDPLVTDVEAVRHALERSCETSPSTTAGSVLDVPVAYGGAAGPDLADVARLAGMSPESVIERHASSTYRVFMLGFLPGFPYMGIVDAAIAAPRRASPRVRVPAGSVGIAGRQTCIYPHESPGGWQLIGRTALKLFDPHRTPASVLAPGDRVRFVPAGFEVGTVGIGVGIGARIGIGTTPSRVVTVIRPGLFTTVQDGGRWGHQADGVPVAGPMDPAAHRLANRLAGNATDSATLEATIVGPELRLEADATVAIAGADLGAALNGAPLLPGRAANGVAGSVLRFGQRVRGARTYIAFDGGVDVPPTLGSRATHVLSDLGGLDGRALKAGDVLPLRSPDRGQERGQDRGLTPKLSKLPQAGGARVRVIPGPQSDFFEPQALDLLRRARFSVSPQSDRMGYRLTGPLIPRTSREMISSATFTGAVQIPPSGEPILLMADRQTTGGYPQIAVVITADFPLTGQLVPGDWIEFEVCTREEAVAALAEQQQAATHG